VTVNANSPNINAAIVKNFTAIKSRIAESDAALYEDQILAELAQQLGDMDAYEAEVGLAFRIDALCRRFAPLPPPTLPVLPPLPTVRRWAHERKGDREFIDLSCINNGADCWLIVDADFYDRVLAGGETCLKIEDGDILTEDGRRLANIVATPTEEFYSVQQRVKQPSVFDFRRENLLVTYTKEQREGIRRRAAEERRDLVGSVGARNGADTEWSDEDVAEHLLNNKGRLVTTATGRLIPVDDYRPRMFQVGGHRVNQAFEINDAPDTQSPTYWEPAQPVKPKGSRPDGMTDEMSELIQQAVTNPKRTTTGAECRTRVAVGRVGAPADSRPIEADCQPLLIPDSVARVPMRKTKPKPLTGTNGLSRAGTVERSAPPWTEKWTEGICTD
jgi:hypothetical protein